MLGLSQMPSYVEMEESAFENLAFNAKNPDKIRGELTQLSNVHFFTGDPELGTLKKIFST